MSKQLLNFKKIFISIVQLISHYCRIRCDSQKRNVLECINICGCCTSLTYSDVQTLSTKENASHVFYANEPAVGEKESARQRRDGLKMADGEDGLGTGLSGALGMDGPVAKRSKTAPGTNCGFKVAEAEQFMCASADTENWEAAAVDCAQPAGKEAKPVMAVEQAPAAALGEDNNELSASYGPAVKLGDSAMLGTNEEAAGMKENGGKFNMALFLID